MSRATCLPQPLAHRLPGSLSSSRGFSLIEMAVVLVVIGAIAVILVPSLLTTTQRSREQRARDQVESLRRSVVGYVLENGELPPDTDTMFNRRDPWGQTFDYFPAEDGGGPIDINCGLPPAGLFEVTTTFETVENVAFVVRSTGHAFADNARNFAYIGNPPAGTGGDVFDVSQSPGGGGFPDDHYAFMTYYQLVRVVCRD